MEIAERDYADIGEDWPIGDCLSYANSYVVENIMANVQCPNCDGYAEQCWLCEGKGLLDADIAWRMACECFVDRDGGLTSIDPTYNADNLRRHFEKITQEWQGMSDKAKNDLIASWWMTLPDTAKARLRQYIYDRSPQAEVDRRKAIRKEKLEHRFTASILGAILLGLFAFSNAGGQQPWQNAIALAVVGALVGFILPGLVMGVMEIIHRISEATGGCCFAGCAIPVLGVLLIVMVPHVPSRKYARICLVSMVERPRNAVAMPIQERRLTRPMLTSKVIRVRSMRNN